METYIHPELHEMEQNLKTSVNELLREIDIGRPSGITLPEVVLVDLTTTVKLIKMLKSLSEVETVVGEKDLPCPVQSQDAVSLCRNVAADKRTYNADEMDFLK